MCAGRTTQKVDGLGGAEAIQRQTPVRRHTREDPPTCDEHMSGGISATREVRVQDALPLHIVKDQQPWTPGQQSDTHAHTCPP